MGRDFAAAAINRRVAKVNELDESVPLKHVEAYGLECSPGVPLMSEQAVPNSTPTGHYLISYADRYAAAWGEINQRIGARQQVYLQFAVVSVAAIVGLFTAWRVTSTNRGLLEWCGSIGLAACTWIFVLWIRTNDVIIGILGAFCKELELGDAERDPPAWHTETHGWIRLARHSRRYPDRAAATLAAVTAAPVAFFAWNHFKSGDACQTIGFLIVAGFGLLAGVYQFRTPAVRTRIAGLTRQNVKDEGERLSKSAWL
jgi:hypothetical protein